MPEPTEVGREMRVVLSTYGGRGDAEPLGVPLVPVGPPLLRLLHGARPASAADVPRLAAEVIVAQFDTLTNLRSE